MEGRHAGQHSPARDCLEFTGQIRAQTQSTPAFCGIEGQKPIKPSRVIKCELD